MKKYLSFFKIRFIAGLQYRAAALAGIATQFAWGGLNILLFRAFIKRREQLPDDLPNYRTTWMQQAFLVMFMAWFFDGDILTTSQAEYRL